MISLKKERYSPEPADATFLNRRLGTARLPYAVRSRHQVADVQKALYTEDVSQTNPFEDPYRAPGGPNEGVDRKIGAYIPPKNMRELSGKFANKCDPLLNPLCERTLPKAGAKHFKGAADPDNIKGAPKFHQVKNPYAAGLKSAAGADPLRFTSAVARKAALARRSRTINHKNFNPSLIKNFLPVDSKNGPIYEEHAPMSDPYDPNKTSSLSSFFLPHMNTCFSVSPLSPSLRSGIISGSKGEFLREKQSLIRTSGPRPRDARARFPPRGTSPLPSRPWSKPLEGAPTIPWTRSLVA